MTISARVISSRDNLISVAGKAYLVLFFHLLYAAAGGVVKFFGVFVEDIISGLVFRFGYLEFILYAVFFKGLISLVNSRLGSGKGISGTVFRNGEREGFTVALA